MSNIIPLRLLSLLLVIYVTLVAHLVHLEPISLGNAHGYQAYVEGYGARMGAGFAVGPTLLSFGGNVELPGNGVQMAGVSATQCNVTVNTEADGLAMDWCARSITRLSDSWQIKEQ